MLSEVRVFDYLICEVLQTVLRACISAALQAALRRKRHCRRTGQSEAGLEVVVRGVEDEAGGDGCLSPSWFGRPSSVRVEARVNPVSNNLRQFMLAYVSD